jgi:hypothetical protein
MISDMQGNPGGTLAFSEAKMLVNFPSHACTRRRTDEIDVPMLRRTLEGEGERPRGAIFGADAAYQIIR